MRSEARVPDRPFRYERAGQRDRQGVINSDETGAGLFEVPNLGSSAGTYFVKGADDGYWRNWLR
jgi:hypothetical protein